MSPSPFHAILFDLGSTLIFFDGDWDELHPLANQEMTRALQSAGLELDEESFAQAFTTRIEEYFSRRELEYIEYTTAFFLKLLLTEWGFTQVPEEAIQSALKARYAVSQPHWKVEEDTIPTLCTLKEHGYRLGLISNAGDDQDVQTLIDRAGIRSFLDVILVSAALGIRKPNPQIFQLALDRWAIAPSQAAMVGDTLSADILGAKNAGIFSIWITRRVDDPADQGAMDNIQPDATIATLSELPGLLANL
ncbi:MAG: HAD-IIIA family hydrolase [Chloroflexota bacterium]